MKGTIEANLTVSFSVIMKIFFSFYLTKAEFGDKEAAHDGGRGAVFPGDH